MTKQLSISRRPRQIKDVIGHEKIKKEMIKRKKENNFPQAMMFQGATGTGKTTVGFIISTMINCKNPVDGYEPCGECESCKSVKNETFGRSIHFFDCSSMGKDDVLKLESVANNSSLFNNEKTILILEEAQQLASAGARGALLKLLEKPRKNVHFILLTMDEKKFDKAIKDRCQVYKFRKIPENLIGDYIFSLLEEIDPNEEIPDSFIEEVIPVILSNSVGSLRKALEDFERCLYSELYTSQEVIKELGLLDDKTLFEILILLSQKDTKAIDKIMELDDILDFFNYSWKILSNIRVADLTGYTAEWKQQRAKQIKATGNFESLLDMYMTIDKQNRGWFNTNVFYFYLTGFYNGKKRKLQENNYNDYDTESNNEASSSHKKRRRRRKPV